MAGLSVGFSAVPRVSVRGGDLSQVSNVSCAPYSVVRGQTELAQGIAQVLADGETAVLLDAAYRDDLKAEVVGVLERLGKPADLADRVLNLDHHESNKDFTATELVLQNKTELLSMKNARFFIDHGDTDAYTALYAVLNIGEINPEDAKFLAAVSRSGDFFEGKLETDAVRLDLAIGGICFANKLYAFQFLGANPTTENLEKGTQIALELIETTVKSLRDGVRVALNDNINRSFWKDSHNKLIKSRDIVQRKGEGGDIPQLTIHNNAGFKFPMVEVLVQDFDFPFYPRGLYEATINGVSPALFMAVVIDENGDKRVRGIGLHPNLKKKTPLNDPNNSFYNMEGIRGKINGGEVGGGLAKDLQAKDIPASRYASLNDVVEAFAKHIREHVN